MSGQFLMIKPMHPTLRMLSVRHSASVFILFSMLLSACSPGFLPIGPTPTASLEHPTDTEASLERPEALVRFRVQIPESVPADEGVLLSILDEVTGLALNVERLVMQQEDATHFFLETPFPIGTLVKYRYTRQGAVPAEEHTSDGRQVRYRMFYVGGPGSIEDVVTRWSDSAFSAPAGRIQGRVIDNATTQPLANLLVVGGGAQAMTASDGTFLIEGLPEGVHNLSVISLDGAYQVFQQGAQVAGDATTPAEIRMDKAPIVNITFNVSAPENTPPGVPLRIAGNLYQLGNTFANLSGGMSSVATRMPVLQPQPDGNYRLTLVLPAGTDLRYKYTLGDGFWNAEQFQSGGFKVRQLIVPENDLVIDETIETWLDGSPEFIVFDVIAPVNTPTGENVSIQFNPFGWTESIPMWSLGSNRWVYFLYSPNKRLNTLSYRYCRNEQCNTADAVDTIGLESTGYSVDLDNPSPRAREIIEEWNWVAPQPLEIAPPESVFLPRQASFMAGVEFLADYHPSWQARFSGVFQDLRTLGAGWVVLSPTWSYTRINPPVLEQVTGQDALWLDSLTAITSARNSGLQVALFPQPDFQMPDPEWWAVGTRDFSWWVVWFERYRVFSLHHADLAARSGAQALILGGDWLTPALPGGVLLDGSPSGVPEDAEIRWRQLIQDVRTRFNGTLLWALPYTPGNLQIPAFMNDLDQIYLLWSVRLSDDPTADIPVLNAEAARLLDEEILPLAQSIAKPIIVGLQYPSANGGITGCVPDLEGRCILPEMFAPPYPSTPPVQLDLKEQADAYSAVLQAVDGREWVSGVVSRGYYPPVILMDLSVSIHGKPAFDQLQYVFSRWLPR